MWGPCGDHRGTVRAAGLGIAGRSRSEGNWGMACRGQRKGASRGTGDLRATAPAPRPSSASKNRLWPWASLPLGNLWGFKWICKFSRFLRCPSKPPAAGKVLRVREAPVAAGAGELRPGCQIWGLLCRRRRRRQLSGPLFASLQLDCAPLLSILEPEAAGGSPVPAGAPAAPIGVCCMPGLCFVSGLCCSAHQRHWAAIFPCFPRWGVQ